MGGNAIGMASDFYRLRLLRLDEEDAPDLEWRDDILYRDPPSDQVKQYACWVVEAVDLDDDEKVTRLEAFEDATEARDYLDAAQEDLEELTRSEFEVRRFPPA
jgi:hypothetical protein